MPSKYSYANAEVHAMSKIAIVSTLPTSALLTGCMCKLSADFGMKHERPKTIVNVSEESVF